MKKLRKKRSGIRVASGILLALAQLGLAQSVERQDKQITALPANDDSLDGQSGLEAESAGQTLISSSGGDSVRRSDQDLPITNIYFTGIDPATNFVRLSIVYPYNGLTYPINCFTNRLDIFYLSDLLESWWELAATTNVSPSAHWIEWTDYDVRDKEVNVRCYAVGNADLDSDHDGFADAREKFMYHSDPNDPASHPASVLGEVSYNGSETGTIYVLATPFSNSWSLGCSISIPSPRLYIHNEVALFRSYWFKSFLDLNSSQSRDEEEPYGLYRLSSTYVTSNLSGINIALQDVPGISGTILYSGTATGNIYIVAVTASNSFDMTYHCLIPWVRGESSMRGGEPFVTFPVHYTIIGMPASNYWIRAFIDEDYNEEHTYSEVAGQYSLNAIPISNRVTGADIAMAYDADGEGMADGWEMMYGSPPDAAGDPDKDGLSSLQESLFGTNPFVQDTDQDGLSDGEEILAGLDPLYNPLEHRLSSLVFTYDNQDRLETVESPPAHIQMDYDAAANLMNAACSKGE